jgi:hypothetical protein
MKKKRVKMMILKKVKMKYGILIFLKEKLWEKKVLEIE